MDYGTMPLYQLRDSDDLEYGILETDCPQDKVEKLWKKYYNEDFEDTDEFPSDPNWSDDLSSDGFAEYLVQLGYKATRRFLDDVRP